MNGSKIKTYNQKDEIVKGDLQIPKLKVDSFKTVEEPTPLAPDNLSKEPGQKQPNTEQPDTPDEPKPVSELDAYKELSKIERDLIKKFYGVINRVDLPEKTKEKIKKNLKKKILK